MISALCVRPGSVYRSLGVDSWDESRNAFDFRGEGPVIAHPPCRHFGRLAFQAKGPRSLEIDLGVFCVGAVRRCGGVLEHPAFSSLWPICGLPERERDSFGGWTLGVRQWWWGHRARKNTWLYIVGIEPAKIPPIPFRLEAPEMVQVDKMGKPERERTPEAFARWLVDLASEVRK